MPTCRHCGGLLREDCPSGITGCREYAEWFICHRGAELTYGEADALSLMAFYCGRNTALPGIPVLPAALVRAWRKKD